MTQEFTMYFLMVMLTLALGFVVQFFLMQLGKANARINKLQENIVKLHGEARNQRTKAVNTRQQSPQPVFGRTRYVDYPKTLEGDLDLHYRGSSARGLRAVLKLDHEK